MMHYLDATAMTIPYTPILLVEDDPYDEQRILQSFDRNDMGHLVHVARDGAEALEYLFGSQDGSILRTPPPRLILLDLRLPRVHGLEVLRRIREHPEGKNLFVIVFTCSREERDQVESTRLGANAFINKPLDITDFPKVMEKIGLTWLINTQ
jgi:two-component system response regulator